MAHFYYKSQRCTYTHTHVGLITAEVHTYNHLYIVRDENTHMHIHAHASCQIKIVKQHKRIHACIHVRKLKFYKPHIHTHTHISDKFLRQWKNTKEILLGILLFVFVYLRDISTHPAPRAGRVNGKTQNLAYKD